MQNKGKLVNIRQRNYLNKDFDSFRTSLLDYARLHYGDKIKDFSESGVGGMFIDMAAYVGDVMSFYLDHQFNELNVETAVEQKNIIAALRAAGVKPFGAAPAVVACTMYIEIPAEKVAAGYVPATSALPVVEQGTIAVASNNVEFELVEDIDFSDVDTRGSLKAIQKIGKKDALGNPSTFILSRDGIFVSGKRYEETISIGVLIRFRKLSLSNESITQIIKVNDSENNEYYEVESLAQDTIFKSLSNNDDDSIHVRDTLQVISAPYRYTMTTDPQTFLTTLQFGGATASSLDDDALPDPSIFSLKLYGKQSFSKFSIDPNSLLDKKTLGIAPSNTVLTITYRAGGGLTHNVSENSIRTYSALRMSFPNSPAANIASTIRSTADITNKSPAAGGEDTPSIEDLKLLIPAFKNSQNRIVSKEDLIARIYTLPSNFGRVFRAGLYNDPTNPLSTQLFIISRNSDGDLIRSPDTLKLNLKTYLNRFRMISDAIEILDARVINVGLTFRVTVDQASHPKTVVRNVISRIQEYFDIARWSIDQPIVISDITGLIYNTPGVSSVINVELNTISGVSSNRKYSDVEFNIKQSTRKGIVIGSPGSIFELKYPIFDIVGYVE